VKYLYRRQFFFLPHLPNRTKNGLNRYKNGSIDSFTSKDGLTDNSIVTIYEDSENNIWIGTKGGGINVLTEGPIETFTTEDGLSSDQIYFLLRNKNGPSSIKAILTDSSGKLWIGSRETLTMISGNDISYFTTSDGLAGNRITTIYETRDKQVIIGTASGVSFYGDKKFVSLPEIKHYTLSRH